MKLTPKQQAFVDAYDGNGTAAARAAGYSGSDATLAQVASENLRKPEVLAAIQARSQVSSQVRRDIAKATHIASRAERQAFWTQVMIDGSQKMSDRLKAAELLGRSEADFTEKLMVQGKLTLEQLVEAASAPKSQQPKLATTPADTTLTYERAGDT